MTHECVWLPCVLITWLSEDPSWDPGQHGPRPYLGVNQTLDIVSQGRTEEQALRMVTEATRLKIQCQKLRVRGFPEPVPAGAKFTAKTFCTICGAIPES